MEVHHHPNVEKKNFKEYFLEFLMIFLAVTLGFFAENVREHFKDEKTGQEYLETFQQELIHNKNIIHRYDSMYSYLMPAQDTLVQLFFEKKENDDLQTTARILLHAKRILTPSIDVAAYQQMVNSGGLKYIYNTALKDSMSHYAGAIQAFDNYNSIVYANRAALYPSLCSLEDIHDFTSLEHIPQLIPYPALTERERRLIISFYRMAYIQFVSNKRLLAQLNASNESLLNMVKNELNQ